MALSLRQKAVLKQDPDARERVASALVAVASTVIDESDPGGTGAPHNEWIHGWIDQAFSRIINSTAIAAVNLELQADNNALTPEQTDTVDTALTGAIDGVFTQLSETI